MTDHNITTIKDLIRELELGSSLDGYLGLMNRVKISKEEVLPFCTWDNKKYTRNLLKRTNEFELIVMCWEGNQKSLIHSYGNQQGWMYVVSGGLIVNHYFESFGEKKMQYYKEVPLSRGRFVYVNDYLGFHNVSNASTGRSISLHLHAGPVEKWKVYDPHNNAFFMADTTIDAEFNAK